MLHPAAVIDMQTQHLRSQRFPLSAGFLLVLTSLLDALSGYAAVRVLTAPFIWFGTNSLAVFAGDILLQVSAASIATLTDGVETL